MYSILIHLTLVTVVTFGPFSVTCWWMNRHFARCVCIVWFPWQPSFFASWKSAKKLNFHWRRILKFAWETHLLS